MNQTQVIPSHNLTDVYILWRLNENYGKKCWSGSGKFSALWETKWRCRYHLA